MNRQLKLGVNIDHVATLRQARYATMLDAPQAEPCLIEAAKACQRAGADSITVHLRADRRHIQDRDVFALREQVDLPLNLEMGNTQEILEIALQVKPDYICLVPENRAEITTEGGLDVLGAGASLLETIQALQGGGAAVSLFVDPELEQIEAAAAAGADMIELHTGTFANAAPDGGDGELEVLLASARAAHGAGLQVNAGHGINMSNLAKLLRVPHLAELNVGHHLVSQALFIGLEASLRRMLEAMADYSPE